MEAPYPSPRSVRHAFMVLEQLPHEALFDLAERLIDRLDAIAPDSDLEPEEDACDAGECGGLGMRGDDGRAGDPDDAELDEDELDDVPLAPGTLRPERDGLVRVWRKGIVPTPNGHAITGSGGARPAS